MTVSDTAVVEVIRHSPKLEHITITDGYLTTAAIEALVASCAPLNSVEIGWKVASTPALHAAAVSSALGRIKHLSIVSILPEHADSLEQTLSHMPALTSFTLSQGRMAHGSALPIPAQVLKGLVRDPPTLTSLSVDDCPLSGDFEQVLAQLLCSTPTLSCLYCERRQMALADATVMLIAEHCRNLETLMFQASPRLTDATISALVRNCRQLNFLAISGGTSITDNTLGILAEHCTGLSYLFLTDSWLVTGPAVLRLLHRCQDMIMLHLHIALATSAEAAEMGRILKARYGNAPVFGSHYHA
jgi:hypothetical protein